LHKFNTFHNFSITSKIEYKNIKKSYPGQFYKNNKKSGLLQDLIQWEGRIKKFSIKKDLKNIG